MPPWSYSSLTAFETCPKKYYHLRIAKDVLDPPGEAAVWGQTVHKHLEEFVRDGTILPKSLSYLTGIVSLIANKPGDKLVEAQMAITPGYSPTNWFDKQAWCRGIVDVGIVRDDRAVLLDYKTGKRKPDIDQLQLFAGLVFSHYPAVNSVRTGFLWLKEGRMDSDVFKREQVSDIWKTFIPRVRRMEIAYEEDKWPAKPSGLCRAWCSVGKDRCQFCGQ